MRTEKRHVSLIYQGGRAHVTYQPKGVIGVMAPWNYPFSLVMIPLATAITPQSACGLDHDGRARITHRR